MALTGKALTGKVGFQHHLCSKQFRGTGSQKLLRLAGLLAFCGLPAAISPAAPAADKLPVAASRQVRATIGAARPTARWEDGQVVLENENLQATFSEETGSLLSLVSKKTGWPVHRRAELGRNFQMLVPVPGRRNNRVLGEKQNSPGLRLEGEDSSAPSVLFTWNGLESEYAGQLDIRFVGKVTITADNLVFEAEVFNRSGYTVETLNWPCLGDLTVPPGADRFEHKRLYYCAMHQTSLYPVFRNQVGYWGTDHPLQYCETPSAPFVLADSGNEGLYMGYHDTSLERMVMFTFQLKPGMERTNSFSSGTVPTTETISGEPVHFEMAAIHFTYLADGQSQQLYPIVVKPYVGSWHHGADVYKAWRKTWFVPPKLPPWASHVHSWQQIHINSPEDELRVPYRDLVQYGKDCARHGVDAIQLTGWTTGGQDRGNPSHDVDQRLGSKEDLAWAIDQVQKLGVKMVMFNKFTWSDRSSEWFRKELVQHAMKDPFGDYYSTGGYRYQTPAQFANINLRRLVPMCHSEPAWREIAAGEYKKSLDLGADGMLYDENQGHGATHYCFDRSHNHPQPGFIYAGDIELARKFHQIKQEKKSDYLIAGEASFDLQMPYYEMSYFRIYKNHVPLHRYIATDSEMMIGVFGHNDRHLLNQALMYRYIISYEPRNYKGRLHEFPLTLEYGKQVDQLRRRYQDLLWHSEFRDTVGATVLADNESFDTYSVFLDPDSGRRAVVVANPHADRPLAVEVRLPDGNGPLVSATPEKPVSQSSDGHALLPALSTIVFMESDR